MKRGLFIIAMGIMSGLLMIWIAYWCADLFRSSNGTPATLEGPIKISEVVVSLKPCDPELTDIALDELATMGLYAKVNYIQDEAEAEASQTELNCLRAWVKDQTDRCLRNAYNDWLDSYQLQLNEARYKLTHRPKNPSSYEAERQVEKARLQYYRETHDVPKPTGCNTGKVKP